MNSEGTTTFIMMPEADLVAIRQALQEIMTALPILRKSSTHPAVIPDYIPAAAFMKAVNIKRTKLHELITGNTIRTLKKGRKRYVLASEVGRYFSGPSIR